MNAEPGARGVTFLSELLRALAQAGEYNAQDQAPPAAILWTDKERQWEPLAPRLREALPHFLTLGPYAPEMRAGPAIWVKCMIERALPGAGWPENVTPILYLPGVSRHELRSAEECPKELLALFELQYRGVWFTHESTKDWTVSAFLVSKRGGLGLDVAGDGDTREALLQALTKLADTPTAELRGRRLQAADFRALLQPDLAKQLLQWLSAPTATRQGLSIDEWQAFRAACRDRFGLDPEADGELIGAEKLGSRDGRWDQVWFRFSEAPDAYSGLPDLLRRAKPKGEALPLFFRRECWPQCNEEDEASLGSVLAELEKLAPEKAAAEIQKLEASHGPRRSWVWAKLEQAPLAEALHHLALLARETRTSLGGENATEMATRYDAGGWQADAAVLDALAVVTKAPDVAAVKAAIQAVYKPWLEAGAERFQRLIRESQGAVYTATSDDLADIKPGACIVFADGLRLDLGKRLRIALETEGFLVEESWRWVPLPSVTGTSKPAASPVADLLVGGSTGGDQFAPTVRATGQPLTVERFRVLLAERGYQALRGDDRGDPAGNGWVEYGGIDQRGHDEGWKLARRIGEEIAGIVDLTRNLLEAGWREVRVVTDHGWLLLPGGLPKVEMPQYLVESRWTRCGALKPGANVGVPTMPWHWNPDIQIALAPGIGSFLAGTEYSHGSLSLQECVVLALAVRSPQPAGPSATIASVRWTGLRCRVQVSITAAGWRVDLRTKAADAASSLAVDRTPQAVSAGGEASLVIDDPDREGTAAMVVLLDPDGTVRAKHNTTVGGEG